MGVVGCWKLDRSRRGGYLFKALRVSRREGSKHMQWENREEKPGLHREMGERQECQACAGAKGKMKFKADIARNLHTNAQT